MTMTDKNQSAKPAGPAKVKKAKGWFRETVETVVIAFILAMIIRTFVVQVFWIPSSSMEPTLDIKDRIVANKFIYWFQPPARGDVIVFKSLEAPPRDFIKRIIGLPGDVLELREGAVYINGQKLDESRHPMNQDDMNFGPITVPPDHYFMMGDNRPASADSRYWGPLPKKNIKGQAFIIIWPFRHFGLIPK